MDSSEILGKVVAVLKVVFELLMFLGFAVFHYGRLLYRLVVPGPKKSLDGEIMLITGAGTGIGRECFIKLAREHKKTIYVLWDWNADELKRTADEAKKFGVKVVTYQIDVTDRNKVEETAKKVQQEVGDVTILFNNAGIARIGSILELKPEDIDKVIQVNLVSHFWTLRAFLPHMIEKNHGHIVTTASCGSFFGVKYGAPYFAAKFGIRGYLESLEDELRVHPKNPDRIKLTTIFPSFVRTPMTKDVILKVNNKEDPSAFLEVRDVAAIIVDGILRNEEKIVIPKFFELLILFKNTMPWALFKLLNQRLFDGDVRKD